MKNYKIKKLVEKIKMQEEEKYGITFDIETPTMIKYYIDNFKNKKISLDEDGISTVLMGVNSAGFAAQFSDNNYICIFNRDYELDYILSEPLLYLKNLGVSFQEFEISRILYHEIRHILQSKRQDLFTPFERFCNFQLSFTTDSRYYYDNNYHDCMYNEIDANIYSYEQLYLKYHDNPTLKKYILKKLIDVQFLSYMYDFDFYFKKYSLYLKENGLNSSPYINSLNNLLWNKDGSFKNITEVFHNFKDCLNDDLIVKLLTSDAFLSSINFDDLTASEENLLEELLSRNDLLIDRQKEKVDHFIDENLINQDDYNKAIKLFKKMKDKKEEYRQLIKGRDYLNVRKMKRLKKSAI